MHNDTSNVQKSAYLPQSRVQISEQSSSSSHHASDEREARSAGLVPFSTSDTLSEAIRAEDSQLIQIDREASRLKRMKSGVLTAARLIFEEVQDLGERWRPWMITPTYRPGEAWKPYHITALCKCLRAWAKRRGFRIRYVWVAEIQAKRYSKGALPGECVHYHLLCWIPRRFSLPKPDKQGWWNYGSTSREIARRPLRYILKYVSKGGDVEFPKGLRIHGFGGLDDTRRNQRTWWLMPRWVRKLWSADDKPRRAKGGGFEIRATGEWFPSIWMVQALAGSVLCSLRQDILDYFRPSQVLRLFCETT